MEKKGKKEKGRGTEGRKMGEKWQKREEGKKREREREDENSKKSEQAGIALQPSQEILPTAPSLVLLLHSKKNRYFPLYLESLEH